MTSRDRLLLTFVAPLAVLGALWFLVFSPQRDEAQRLDTEIAAAQTRLATAESDVARYEEARHSLQRTAADLEAAGRAVPARTAVPELLRQLERTAKRSGVEMRAITTSGSGAETPDVPATTGESAAPGEVVRVGVTLTFAGRFFELQRLLSRLDRFIDVSDEEIEATGRLLAAQSLDLTGEGGGLVAQLDATVFVLPPIVMPAAAEPVDGAVVASTDTGGPSVPTAAVGS